MKNIRNIKKVVVIAFMAAVMYALTACGTTTIDLNKYIEIESAGYDSYGTVKYEFDDEAFGVGRRIDEIGNIYKENHNESGIRK